VCDSWPAALPSLWKEIIRGPHSILVLVFTRLVPEIIQHEAAMHFVDEVGHVVHNSVAEGFAYGSVTELS
jgi:hypothetical protein